MLESTHLFERLPAYTSSRSTRLLKSPMAYWTDPGLAVFLSGCYDEESLRRSRQLMDENIVAIPWTLLTG